MKPTVAALVGAVFMFLVPSWAIADDATPELVNTEWAECNGPARIHLDDLDSIPSLIQPLICFGEKYDRPRAAIMLQGLRQKVVDRQKIADRPEYSRYIGLIADAQAIILHFYGDDKEATPTPSPEPSSIPMPIYSPAANSCLDETDQLKSKSPDNHLFDKGSQHYFASLEECYWSKDDYTHAVAVYPSLNSANITSGQISLIQGNTITSAELFYHIALSAEKIGKAAQARLAIRDAHRTATSDDPDAKAIDIEYHRIDAVRIAAQAQADREKARQEEADRLACANGDDKTKVWCNRGEPCSITTSEDSYIGTLVTYYYDCISAGGIGRESFTFLNGRLTNHTQL